MCRIVADHTIGAIVPRRYDNEVAKYLSDLYGGATILIGYGVWHGDSEPISYVYSAISRMIRSYYDSDYDDLFSFLKDLMPDEQVIVTVENNKHVFWSRNEKGGDIVLDAP